MFFIIWRGRGIAVVGFAILGVFATNTLGSLIGGANVGGHTHSVATGFGILLAAIPVWFFGQQWNAPQKDRVLIDQETGQRIAVTWKPRHTLYYVPMQYWAVVLAAAGVLFIVAR